MIWLIFTFLFSIDFVPPPGEPVSKDTNPTIICKKYQSKYLVCLEEIEANRKTTKNSIKKEEITFINGCLKNPEEIEECFYSDSSSCELIFFCVQKKYIRVFGKENRF